MREFTVKQNEYTWSAKYYDDLCNINVVQEDVEFYKLFLTEHSSILELGCGTGRVGLELAAISKDYVGLDLSPQMLNIFRAKIDSSIQNITLYQSNMTEFNIDKIFDLIIFPFRSFQALTTDEQRNKCLNLCRKHLTDSGKIIIQLFNPDFEKLDYFDTVNTHDNTVQDGRYKIERHTIGNGHDKMHQTISASYVYKVFDGNDLIKTIEEPLFLGYMTADQAKKLFNSHQLAVSSIYKWWDFSKIDEELKELIFVLNNDDASL